MRNNFCLSSKIKKTFYSWLDFGPIVYPQSKFWSSAPLKSDEEKVLLWIYRFIRAPSLNMKNEFNKYWECAEWNWLHTENMRNEIWLYWNYMEFVMFFTEHWYDACTDKMQKWTFIHKLRIPGVKLNVENMLNEI